MTQGSHRTPSSGTGTLACCKPAIRRTAVEGDWIVGLTPKAQGNRVIYYMKVEQVMGFDAYWRDSRFRARRAKPNFGIVRKSGDNIYEPKLMASTIRSPQCIQNLASENAEIAN